MFLSTHERHPLAEQFDMIPPITWEIPSPNNVFTSVNKPRLLTLWENKFKSCHRILMNTWSTMFSWQREVYHKQHIALFNIWLISYFHTPRCPSIVWYDPFCHRILMNTWSTMFSWQREVYNKQHIALFWLNKLSLHTTMPLKSLIWSISSPHVDQHVAYHALSTMGSFQRKKPNSCCILLSNRLYTHPKVKHLVVSHTFISPWLNSL